MRDPYESLAQAIILRAVKDYRRMRAKHKRHPKNKEAELMIEDCERFFRSAWFTALTDVDGAVLLKKLKEEDIS